MKSIYFTLFSILFLSSVPQLFAAASTTEIKINKYTCIKLINVLQHGSKDTTNSNEVYKLRNFLKEDGDFRSSKIDTLGYFGTNTKTALIVFQKKHKIIGTGVVGQLTRTKIKEISCASVPDSSGQKVSTNTSIIKETKVAVPTTKETVTIKEVPVIIKETPTIFVKTMLASDITANTAILNGKGGIDGEKHWFEWGKTMGLNSATPQVVSTTTYSAKITALLPQTMYYFRAVTSVATTTDRKGEIAFGDMRYFTTPAVSTGDTPITPTVSISSTQTAVDSSGSRKVIWTSTNSNICRFTGGEEGGSWTSQTSLSGSYVTKPMTKDAVFGIYCTSPSGNTVTGSLNVLKIAN